MNDILLDFWDKGKYVSADLLVNEIINTNMKSFIDLSISLEQKNISPSNIPQYSSIENGTRNIITILRKSGNYGPTFTEIGRHILGIGKLDRAYTKYGENHAKLANLLGFTDIIKDGRYRVYLNDIGLVVEKKTIEEQNNCISKLVTKIPIIQYALKTNINDKDILANILRHYLSESTMKRRLGNTWKLLQMVRLGELNGI